MHCREGGEGAFFEPDGVLGSDISKNGRMHLDFVNGQFGLDFPESKRH